VYWENSGLNFFLRVLYSVLEYPAKILFHFFLQSVRTVPERERFTTTVLPTACLFSLVHCRDAPPPSSHSPGGWYYDTCSLIPLFSVILDKLILTSPFQSVQVFQISFKKYRGGSSQNIKSIGMLSPCSLGEDGFLFVSWFSSLF